VTAFGGLTFGDEIFCGVSRERWQIAIDSSHRADHALGRARNMVLRFVSTFIKIVLASLLVGVTLAYLDIRPEDVLRDVGLTPQDIFSYLDRGLRWAMPHVILGAIVTVPVWLVIYLFRPPRG
jgi:hypothetical protein